MNYALAMEKIKTLFGIEPLMLGGGSPRYVASPDINTEVFQAAVDFLSVQDNVDPEKIGIVGICGWGGLALNAAAIDTRIKAAVASFLNIPILQYSSEIRSVVLIVHGEKAHSCYFSKDAFEKLTGDNKELMIIPEAVHTDLYDRIDVIPFDKLEAFLPQT